MSNIIPFPFGSKEIRVTDQNGDPWFILRDLLDAMESTTKVTDAVESIKQGLGDGFVSDVPILDGLGRKQTAIIVSEPAATYLLSRSNTEKGRELNRFIHVEVLPGIRKTGSYHVGQGQPQSSKTDRIRSREIKETFNCFFSIAKLCNFDGNMAILSANQATQAYIGVNPLALMGRVALESDNQEQLLIVSEIAERLDWTPRLVNPRLTACELQTEYRDHHKRLCYELTEMGKAFGVYVDTGKKHGDGSPVRQIKWRASVVEFLNQRFPVGEDA